MEWWQWLGLLLFLTGTLYMIIAVGKATSGGDSKNDMAKAITNVTIVNAILIIIIMGIAYFYASATDHRATAPYLILMVHASLLLSVVSVSITSLQKLNR
jgi:hypothetical protein